MLTNSMRQATRRCLVRPDAHITDVADPWAIRVWCLRPALPRSVGKGRQVPGARACVRTSTGQPSQLIGPTANCRFGRSDLLSARTVQLSALMLFTTGLDLWN